MYVYKYNMGTRWFGGPCVHTRCMFVVPVLVEYVYVYVDGVVFLSKPQIFVKEV